MPQLDTIYILMTYLWTWSMLVLTAQKIKKLMVVKCPSEHMKTTKTKPTMTLPW